MTTPAGGFALADAFVRIRPDAGGFRAEATSQIKSATAGINPTIKVSANTNPAKASIADFNAYARAVLRGQDVPIKADAAQAQAEVANLAGQLAVLARTVWSTRLVIDDPGLQARLGSIMGQLRDLERTFTGTFTMDGVERVQNELLGLEATVERITGRAAMMHIEIDDADAERQLALLTVQFAALATRARTLRIGVDDPGVLANLQGIATAIQHVREEIAGIPQAAGPAEGQIENLRGRLQELTGQLDSAMPAAIARTRNAWFGWAALANRIPLFGGLVAGIGLWHVLADAIIEAAAVLIPAGIAFGAFAIAANSAATSVYNHIKAVQTVTEATGQAVGPFTNAFSKIADAVTPHVYELFGQAMQIINSRVGAFSGLAERAAQVMDMFGARIELAVTSSGFQKFLGNAISDLTTVGDIIGNLFGIFGELVKMVAGVAQTLFHAILDITGAMEKFLGIPIVQRLGQIIVGFHGYWIWLGLATSAIFGIIPLLARLTGGLSETTKAATGFTRLRSATIDLAGNTGILGLRFSKLKATLTGIAASPWTWAITGAVVLGALIVVSDTFTTATQRYINAVQASIEKNATWGNIISVVSGGLATLNAKQQEVTQSSQKAGDSAQYYAGALGRSSQVLDRSQHATVQLSQGQQRFSNQLNLTGFRLGDMARRFGGLGQAMGLAQLAGIKTTDIFKAQGATYKNDLEQIQGLIQGYKYMGVQSGALGNSVKALQLLADGQITSVNQLNQAWTQFFGIVSGGDSTFVTFAQNMLAIPRAAAQSSAALNRAQASVAGAQQRLNTLQRSGTATSLQLRDAQNRLQAAQTQLNIVQGQGSASLNGLNQSSLQLRQNWIQSLTSAQAYYAALQTQSAAASDAARGQALLHRAGADLIRILGPAAKGSATLREDVFALAQQFGFTRAQMVRLIDHAGSLKKNELDLQKVNVTLAKSVSNVGKDWAAMATTLQGQVKQALEAVALSSSGAKTAAAQLAVALRNQGPSSKAAGDAYSKLVGDLHASGLSWQQAKDFADAYTKGLHSNAAAIIQGEQSRLNLQAQTQTQTTFFKNVATAMSTYSGALGKNASATAQGRQARLNLIDDIYNTGVKAGISGQAIDRLIAKILKIPTHEALSLIMQATGKYNITGTTTQFGQGFAHRSAQGGSSLGAAHGMRVPGTGNRDSVHAMLTPGEAVVPKSLVPAVAPFLSANKVPGFATGGFVGQGTYPAIAPQAASFQYDAYAKFKDTALNALTSTLKSALQSAILTAQQAFTPGQSAYGGSAAAMAFARRLLPAYGWANQWPALFDLWERESGWNPYAVNPTSGAYGIPQSLGHGHPYALGDYANQIRWGLAYIRSTYGSPDAAWGHELAFGWYDGKPGWSKSLPRGLSLALNTTGGPEPVGDSGMSINVTVNVMPGSVMTGNPVQIGQALARYIQEATKRGQRLYPQGVTPRL